jgi:hypothetical protein
MWMAAMVRAAAVTVNWILGLFAMFFRSSWRVFDRLDRKPSPWIELPRAVFAGAMSLASKNSAAPASSWFDRTYLVRSRIVTI